MELIIILSIFLMPYSIIGESSGSAILGMLGSLYILYRARELSCFNEELKENRHTNLMYFSMLMLLAVCGIVSLLFSNSFISSLNGLYIYINVLLYYFVFWDMRDNKEKILKYSIYTVVVSGVIFSIYQGIILNRRIDGNIGYANTYGLLLLIALYINVIIENKYFSRSIQVILMIAIFFTGSRNTFILMMIYIIGGSTQLLSFFISIIIYAAIKYGGIGVIIFVPIILYLYEKLSGKIKGKFIYGASAILGLSSILLFINTQNEFFSRIKGISIKNPVLQERFVFFQDAAAKIFKYPFGTGINSFEYSQYIHQSAFYDVKYIHNSVLQIGYDMGIPAAVIFILLFILGLCLIMKSMEKGKNKIYYAALYITIFAHSMLDFDFSYGSIFIIAVMITVFAGTKQNEKKNAHKSYNKGKSKKKDILNETNKTLFKKSNLIIVRAASSIVLILALYLIIVNTSMLIGDKYVSEGKYKKAEVLYNFNKSITYNDPNPFLKLAQLYNGNNKSINYNGKIELEKCIEYLKAALEINPDDPRIYGNLAFINQKTGNEEDIVKYYREFLKREKFYSEIYKLYYEYLCKQLERVKSNEEFKTSKTIDKHHFSVEFYEAEIKSLKELYKNSYKKLNPKSKYMKDQMTEDFGV